MSPNSLNGSGSETGIPLDVVVLVSKRYEILQPWGWLVHQTNELKGVFCIIFDLQSLRCLPAIRLVMQQEKKPGLPLKVSSLKL